MRRRAATALAARRARERLLPRVHKHKHVVCADGKDNVNGQGVLASQPADIEHARGDEKRRRERQDLLGEGDNSNEQRAGVEPYDEENENDGDDCQQPVAEQDDQEFLTGGEGSHKEGK